MASNLEQFNSILVHKPARNAFDLSFGSKLTCEIGQLIPIFVKDYQPGDKVRLTTEMLIKFAPMLAPIMHEVDARVDFFRCDYHLVNDKMVECILGDEDGAFSSPIQALTWAVLDSVVKEIIQESTKFEDLFPDDFVFTYDGITQYLFGSGSLWDYLGFPSLDGSKLGALADEVPNKGVIPYVFFLHGLVWNEYFRDQNVMDKIEVPHTYADINTFGQALASGSSKEVRIFIQCLVVRNRCQPKDYFTSALPEPQRGGEVHLPIGGTAPVSGTSRVQFEYDSAPETSGLVDAKLMQLSGGKSVSIGNSSESFIDTVSLSGLSADMSAVTMATINEIRRAEALQKYLELSARSGGRPGERIWANFAVRPSDSRLGRPEYLGGGKVPIVISEVKQTGASIQDSETGLITNDPLGTMSGHGTAVGSSPRFDAYFNDYGLVIGYLTIIPRPAYFQGIPRMYQRFDPFEYYLPLFAQLGEQPIRNSEVYLEADADKYDAEFGYTPRYAEYSFNTNEVHGLFRTTLSYWHMAREFGSLPALNSDFLEINALDYNRVFPVLQSQQSTQHVYVNLWFQYFAVREVVKYNIPTL